jgi:hypothetical protein
MDKVVGKLAGYIGETIAGNFHRNYNTNANRLKTKKPPGDRQLTVF